MSENEGLAMLRQLLERTAPSEPEPEHKAARF